MKKGEVYEGIVEKVDFPNKGYVNVEDRKVSIKGVIKGQKVSFRIKKSRKENCQGILQEVLEPADLQDQKPECPHFGKCGGCFYQDVSYENQLQIKEGQVKDLLKEVQMDAVWEPIVSSPECFGYRNKMEFSFGDEVKDGPLALGMHKKNSFHDIVIADQCNIVNSDYNLILKETLEYFREKKIPFYKKMQHEGVLRHLVIRRSFADGGLLINLCATTQQEIDMDSYIERLLALPLNGQIAGILLTKNDGLADVVQSDETILCYGKDYIYEKLLGLTFKISPFSFFQTNSKGAELLYQKARNYILYGKDVKEENQNEMVTLDLKDKTVFDLYSGTGTIAQILAPVAKKVIGVEIVEEAVAAAKENAKLNHLDNCEFIAGDVLKVLDEIEEVPDFIVLDPPRDGIHPKAIGKIIDYGVEQMIYISCKPTSLQRDLKIFEARGYQPKRIGCVDMFPQTLNIETVVLLSQVNGFIQRSDNK